MLLSLDSALTTHIYDSLQVSCWEVQQSGQTIPKAQQTHAGPVLDVDWSDVRKSHARQYPGACIWC